MRRIKLSEYAKNNSISYQTAYNYWKLGQLKGIQLPSSTILVDIEDSKNLDNSYSLYCRVSSHDQKEDLVRQEDRLKLFCNNNNITINKIYKEVASGVNDKRPKLQALLESSDSIIVEHADRLTRFGLNYIVTLLKLQNRKLVIVNNNEYKDDIIKDFISIITSFCARIYGSRRSKRKTEEIKAIL